MKQRSSRNVVMLSVSMIISSALIAGGIAYAAGETITACVKKSNGATRIISGKMKCTKTERTVTWGSTGEQGATGATGATGAQGPAGTSVKTYFAHVDPSGFFADTDDSGVITTVSRPLTGYFIVNFNRSLTGCVPVVGAAAGATASAEISDFGATSYEVHTFESATGNNANYRFTMAVFCDS